MNRCGAIYFLLSRRCLVTCTPIETMVHTQMSIRPPLKTWPAFAHGGHCNPAKMTAPTIVPHTTVLTTNAMRGDFENSLFMDGGADRNYPARSVPTCSEGKIFMCRLQDTSHPLSREMRSGPNESNGALDAGMNSRNRPLGKIWGKGLPGLGVKATGLRHGRYLQRRGLHPWRHSHRWQPRDRPCPRFHGG